MSTEKVFDYLQKHKDEIDKTYIIIICQLLLLTDFNYNHLKKLLKGAHFIIKDNGLLYTKWKKFSNKKSFFKNISSHYSCNIPVRIGKNKICNVYGHINHNYDCLIGTICSKNDIHINDNNHKHCHTWFQFEKSRLNNIIDKINHSIDFLDYFVFRKNIGPFGKSHNTQNNPIILKLKNIKNDIY